MLCKDFSEKSLPRNTLVVGLQPLQPQGSAAGAIALAQIHRLPCAKAQLAFFHQQQQGWPVQGGFDVGIAVALGMAVIAVLWGKLAEKGQHVALDVWVCPFVDREPTGGVRAKQAQGAALPAAIGGLAAHQRAQLRRYVHHLAAAAGAYFKVFHGCLSL